MRNTKSKNSDSQLFKNKDSLDGVPLDFSFKQITSLACNFAIIQK